MHAVKMSLLSWLKKSNQIVAPEQEQVDSQERLEQEEQASGIIMFQSWSRVLDNLNDSTFIIMLIKQILGGLYISTMY
jgi:hypothetical protein